MSKKATNVIKEREEIVTGLAASITACALSISIANVVIPMAQTWRISTSGTAGVGGEVLLVAAVFVAIYIVVTKIMESLWRKINSKIQKERLQAKEKLMIKETFNKEMLALRQHTCIVGVADITAEGHVFFKTSDGTIEEYPSVKTFLGRFN